MDVRAEMSTRLRSSEGWVVESPSGRFGTIEAFRDGGGRRSDLLVVRAGWRGRRRMMISIDDIAAVRPRERVVQLRSKWMTMQA